MTPTRSGGVISAEVEELSDQMRSIEQTLESPSDLDPLLERIGDARYVLLGEASHGTSEYYLWRARLSQRLIREKGFSFIAVEGDWPDCYGVNRYVKHYPNAGENAYEALRAFDRWPTWMWANWETVALVEWLREVNRERVPSQLAGFYGLDVYSLWESMAAVMDYLREKAPGALGAAQRAFLCFEPYRGDEQAYAWSTSLVPESCESEVVDLLAAVRRQVRRYPDDPEAAFDAEQNAWVLVEAERYYRTMMRSDAKSWNVRDVHMADSLDRLVAHHGKDSKAIVWEHNTHVGDARATDMAYAGMVNVGQLVRERHGGEGVVLIGFGSERGSVIAGEEWGAPMERMLLPPARPGSWEDVLHRASARDKMLFLTDLHSSEIALEPRGHRAVGVVYRGEREQGNYVPTVLPVRYDAFLFLDETHALHPLHVEADPSQPPDTYPWGV